MAFGFTQRSDVQEQVRQIAIEQIDGALAACRGEADFDKTVHGLRRRCKKLRGLLRLVEPRFEGFETENRAVRAAAGGLAGMRDAAVMIETFDGLLRFDRAQRIDAGLADAVRKLLEGRVADQTFGAARQQLLGEFRGAMEQVGHRAKAWSIRRRGFAGLGGGLERTYRRMADDLETAITEDTAMAMHDWRKHTKYHWHHLTLLSRAAPDVLGNHTELLNQLGELLGDHHNLHVLAEYLAAQPNLPAAGGVGTIEAIIVARQSSLAKRAFALGRQLTAEKPGALRRRFEHYWQLLPVKGEQNG